MSDNPFKTLNDVFKDRDVLRDDYQPETIVGRDDEKDAYASALRPIANGSAPDNIFLYGQTGVGKTAVTEYMLDRLDEFAQDPDSITTVFFNCQNCTSSYQVATSLVNEMKPADEQISQYGYAPRTIYNLLFEEIEKRKGSTLFILDEIDSIGSDDGLLYELPRARSKGELEESYVGVIGISNDLDFKRNLSPKVKDTLCEKEIVFSPYDADELRSILSHRTSKALDEETYDDGAIAKIAALSARDTGSARQALDLLREAGDIAEATDGWIDEDVVEEARVEAEKSRLSNQVEQLTIQKKLAMLTVAFRYEHSHTDVRTSELYETYQRLASRNDVDALSQRRFRDRLDDLSMLGLASKQKHNDGLADGQYNSYKPDVDFETVDSSLSDLGTPRRL